jgi:tRNA pseudouridine13 synthase
MRRIRREFSLPGRYRRFMNHFLSKPSIDFRTYLDDTEQMHPTDLDLIRAEKTKNKRKGEDQSEGPATKKNKSEPQQTNEGGEDVTMDTNDQEQTKDTDVAQDGGLQTAAVVTEKVAAVVKFQLGSSAYATVTLRELMGDPPEDTTAGDGGTS